MLVGVAVIGGGTAKRNCKSWADEDNSEKQNVAFSSAEKIVFARCENIRQKRSISTTTGQLSEGTTGPIANMTRQNETTSAPNGQLRTRMLQLPRRTGQRPD
ncbi:unnamed protein product [Sphagnum balticum]